MTNNSLPYLIHRTRPGTILLACFCFLLPGLLQADQPKSEKVAQLQKERVAVLERLVALREKEYQEGLISYDQIVEAQDQSADAKYELAKTSAERLEIRKATAKRWSDFEKIVAARFESAAATQGDLLKVRAGYLRARILLAKERERSE